MKKINYMRSMSMVAAILITAASVTSCGKKDSKKKVQTADEVLQNSYSAVEIEKPENLSQIYDIILAKDANIVYVFGSDAEYKSVIYQTDTEFTEFTEYPLTFNEESEYLVCYGVNPDGTLIGIVDEFSYGDLKAPDYENPEFDYENFDYDAYEAARVDKYSLCTYDTEGKELSSIDCSSLYATTGSDDEYFFINSIKPLGDGRNLLSYDSSKNAGLMVIDDKAKVVNTIDSLTDVSWIDSTGMSKNGEPVISYYSDKGMECGYLDIENNKVGETVELTSNGTGTIISGNGDYDFYVNDSVSLLGYNKESKAVEEVVNWTDSDLNGQNVYTVLSLDNGDFIVGMSDGSDGGFYRMSKRDLSTLSDTVVINLATNYTDYTVSDAISEFNKTSDKYRIKVKDYSSYSTEENNWNGGLEQLQNDFLAGESPDIVITSTFGSLESLEAKGAFADLYELMDKDDTVTRESILPNILSMNEVDGKIYTLPTSFSVQTLIGKTKFVGEKENWTADEMIAAYEARPEGMEFTADAYQEYMFSTLVLSNITNFIDYENKTCSFDSPEFIKLLNFCKQFGTDDRDWENMTDDDYDSYHEESQSAARNDKHLVEQLYLYSFRSYHEATAGQFNEPITLVGYPSEDGNGGHIVAETSYSIAADSAVKDGAWEFIKQFYTEEYQSDEQYIYSFPVNVNAFNTKADNDMKPYSWVDENGVETTYPSTYYIGGEEVPIGELTQEERDYIVEYITSLTTSNGYDVSMYTILDEETKDFFGGDKTAEEAAKMIQNRVSIYISEQG